MACFCTFTVFVLDPDPDLYLSIWIRIQLELRLYQVGNTSSCKITEVKQLGPRLALGWEIMRGLDVDAVTTITVKSQKRRDGGPQLNMLLGQKKNFYYTNPDPQIRIRITSKTCNILQ